jgi:hypothetical protein
VSLSIERFNTAAGESVAPRRQEIVMVPFMVGWTVQWNAYVPAAVKTRLRVPPLGSMFADMPHEPSSRATRWGTSSLFVQVITSPTWALIGCDHVMFATVAATSVVAVVSAHGAAAPPAGAEPLLEQAASAKVNAIAAAVRTRNRM